MNDLFCLEKVKEYYGFIRLETVNSTECNGIRYRSCRVTAFIITNDAPTAIHVISAFYGFNRYKANFRKSFRK